MLRDDNVSEEIIENIINLNSVIGLQKVQSEGVETALAGESGTKMFPGFRGSNVLSSFAPLNLDGLNWAILSEIEESEAFRSFSALRDRMIMVGSILIALAVYLSYFLALSLSRPLRSLTESAQALTSGKLDEPILSSTGDEIGDLAIKFERMRITLKNTFF